MWGSPKSPIASIASAASSAILVSEMLAAKHAAFHVSDAPRRRPESLRLKGDGMQGPWSGLYFWEALLQLVYGSGPTRAG